MSRNTNFAKKMTELKAEAKELHELLNNNVEKYEEYMDDESKEELADITKEIHRIRKALRDRIKDDEGNMVARPSTKQYYDEIKERLREELEAINDLFDPIAEALEEELAELEEQEEQKKI